MVKMTSVTVILPFKVAKTIKDKAVSEATFTVDSPISQFSSATITSIRFMRVYEQERYDYGQYPHSRTWSEWKSIQNFYREQASQNVGARADLPFGHVQGPDLPALDNLPNMIELEIVSSRARKDSVHFNTSLQKEYASVDSEKQAMRDENRKLQRMLVYNTNLSEHLRGGWRGSIACAMSNIGTFDLRGQGLGQTFTVKASMYDFKQLALASMPSIELSITFR
jgi:hypothetical protein